MAYISPKDTREIQDYLVDWINSKLIDPYTKVSRNSRDKFATSDDFKLQKVFPVIQVDVNKFNTSRVTQAKKSNYLELEEHNFMIYYACMKGHSYQFTDNNKKLTGESQVIKYLQYLKNQFKANITDFNFYFNNHTFGSISKPILNPRTHIYVGSIPLTVYTYRR